MTTSQTNPGNSAPRLKVISGELTDTIWEKIRPDGTQEESFDKWLEEAQKLNSQFYADLSETENLPNSILRGLYPEVAAFGPNGVRVIQAFQVFQEIDHYLGGANKYRMQVEKAFRDFIRSVENCEGALAEVGSHLVPYDPFLAKGELPETTRAIAAALVVQSHVPEMAKPTLERIGLHNFSVILKVVQTFAIQFGDLKSKPEVKELTEEMSYYWRKLEEELSSTNILTKFPHLMDYYYAYDDFNDYQFGY